MAPRPSFWRRRLLALGRSLEVLSGLVGSAPYSGAQSNRLTLDWVRAATSPDKEIQGSLAALRARSRDVQRNNAYGAQYVRLLKDNVVGPRGIGFQSKVMTNRGNADEATNVAVETAFWDWGQPGVCTVDGRQSWLGLQTLAVGLLHGDGEAFIRLRRGYTGNRFRFALEIVDADLLEETFCRAPGRGGNEIRQSVEVDGDGRAVAYHVLERHPDDINAAGLRGRVRARIPAEDMLHLFIPLRPGQTRGVPGLAPVLFPLRMLGGYQEAEVVAARTAASKLGIITQTAESFNAIPEPPNDGPVTMDAEPGSFWKLLPGEGIEPFDPQHPTTAYKDFVKGVLQQVAAGLGVSYASLTADLEGTSYASGRAGLLQERDRYRAVQQWLIEHLCQPVFAAWLDFARLTVLPALGEAKAEAVLAAASWQPRGFAWVDPKNDVEASILQLDRALTSRTRILGEQGLDYAETMDELRREQDLAATAGVALAPAAPAAPAADKAKDEEPEEKADEEAEDERLAEALTGVRQAAEALEAARTAAAPAASAPAFGDVVFERDEDGRIVGAKLTATRHVRLVSDTAAEVSA